MCYLFLKRIWHWGDCFNSLKNSGVSKMTEKHRVSMVYDVFIRKEDVDTGSRMLFMVYREPKEFYSSSTNYCTGNPPHSLPMSLWPAKCRPLRLIAEWRHSGASIGQVSIMWNFVSAKVPRSFLLYFPRGHYQNLSIRVISVGRLLPFPTLKRSSLPSWNSSSHYSSLLVSTAHLSTPNQPLWRSVSVRVSKGAVKAIG